ncbi:hypothetical protein [Streptacidiphilus rugosus]|uniref:hypothetical protein n=1 Tax=Streptacidiphilus rugosus TaxID=405783 RepID=UPI000AA71C41|nr:hypothetical protein [Streptacidiphilus rugosus]
MSISHPAELPSGSYSSAVARSLDSADWAAAGLPVLSDPRSVVEDLHRIHLPQPGATVLGVLTAEDRVVAGASFAVPDRISDGWHLRNILLAHLRHTVPHGLRRRSPLHSVVLLQCRHEPAGWTDQDGAWMWALRDAAVLHGLRCGDYITMTDGGWSVLGGSRNGHTPHAGSWVQRIVSTVSELPSREAGAAQAPMVEAIRPRLALMPAEAVPRAAAH